MITKKRFSLFETIQWSRNALLLFLLLDTAVISTYYFTELKWISIPWQPLSLIGIGVSFYLGFKNNAAYDRLWEARKIWGGIVNTSRSLTVMIRDFIIETDTGQHDSYIDRHIGWLYAFAFQLREKKSWEQNTAPSLQDFLIINGDLNSNSWKQYISTVEKQLLASKHNTASQILSLQSNAIAQAYNDNKISDYKHACIQEQLTTLYTLQGKAERIKNFPFPRQFTSIYFYFVLIFILLIPFGMIDVFLSSAADQLVWFAIPFSALVSWVFWGMEMVGENSENPFEGSINDIPILQIIRAIEIDLREMTNGSEIPDNLKAISPKEVLF